MVKDHLQLKMFFSHKFYIFNTKTTPDSHKQHFNVNNNRKNTNQNTKTNSLGFWGGVFVEMIFGQ